MRRMTFAVMAVRHCPVHRSVHRERRWSPDSRRHDQRHGDRHDVVAAERHGRDRRHRPVERSAGRRCSTTSTGLTPKTTGTPTLNSTIGTTRRPSTTTFNTAGHLHVPLRRPRLRHDRARSRCRGAGRPTRSRTCSCSPRRPASATTRSRRASRRSRRSARPTTSRSTPPRTAPRSPPRTSRSTTSSSSSPRPATCSTTRSRTRSSATSRPAAATSASTPRPTPSTRGRWYGQMLGAYFRNHPAGTPHRDGRHRGPRRALHRDGSRPAGRAWTSGTTTSRRTTRWSTAAATTTAPRASGVKVLATVDESTLRRGRRQRRRTTTTRSRGARDFDGGRVWYTGWATRRPRSRSRTSASTCSAASRPSPAPSRPTAAPPRQAAPERRGLREGHARRQHAEPDGARRRAGRPRLLHRARRARDDLEAGHRQQTVTAAHRSRSRPVQENGLLGIQLAPDFATSHWVYLVLLAAARTRTNTQVVARFKVNGDTLDLALASSRSSPSSTSAPSAATRPARSYFGPDGNLYISTGDNTNPFDSDGFDPIDERAGRAGLGRPAHVGQHERPQRQDPADQAAGRTRPARPASARRTRSRPATCSPTGTAQDAARDLRDGLPQPVPLHGRPETGWVLMGDYGPDAGATERQPRPAGQRRVQRDHEPGNYGWPYCIRDNDAVQRLRLRDRTVRPASSTAPRRSTTRPTTRA